jgi:uroporphyrinogen-III decarboxylase
MQGVPEGRIYYIFENVDMMKAKEILDGRVFIAANVPLSMFATATLDQVKPYCKKIIDTVGEDGGYIMPSSGSLDDAKPENM